MTDADLVAKKLAEIETRVRELRTLADFEALREDVKEERFVTHTLQLAVQAAIDVASHVVSDDRLGEPTTNEELFVSSTSTSLSSDASSRALRAGSLGALGARSYSCVRP